MAVDNLLYRAADEGNRIARRLPASLSRQNLPRTMALLGGADLNGHSLLSSRFIRSLIPPSMPKPSSIG